MIWDTIGSGGAFGVIPLEEKGRQPSIVPLFRGHTGPVLDIDWFVVIVINRTVGRYMSDLLDYHIIGILFMTT